VCVCVCACVCVCMCMGVGVCELLVLLSLGEWKCVELTHLYYKAVVTGSASL